MAAAASDVVVAEKNPTADAYEEENVLGISIADPEILKSTQWVLTSVSITVFFLGIQLFEELDESEEVEESAIDFVEVMWWAMDTMVQAIMVLSGYIGVKRSNRSLLACFWVLSIFSCAESLTEVVAGVVAKVRAGLIAVRVCEAIFYAVGVHHGRFLWREAGGRSSLQDRGSTASRSSYNMLGIPVVNLRVLRATQSLFTSLGILSCILGQFVIVSAESALKEDGDLRYIWLFSLALWVSMTCSGYFGVRFSSRLLLYVFMALTTGLLVFLGYIFLIIFMAMLVSALGVYWAELWVMVGTVWLLATAASSSFTLLKELKSSGTLAAISVVEPSSAPATSGVSPGQLGASALRASANASMPEHLTLPTRSCDDPGKLEHV